VEVSVLCYSALVRKDLAFLSQKFGANIVSENFEAYLQAVARDPKKYPPMDQERIFPGHFAPVVIERDGQRLIEPMRYGAFPPSFVTDPKKYTAYNARRDNLHSNFWKDMVGYNHGVIVIRGFFEWVKVSDLLRSGKVTIDEVTREFERQAESRKRRVTAAGKPYKPTATEKKDPLMRDVIVAFKPTLHEDLVVPVIFSECSQIDSDHEAIKHGFALLTDDPLPEVRAAGHDRSPILLDEKAAVAWLNIQRSRGGLDEILDSRSQEVFAISC